ncbi:MAG TPA: hypothetical protein VFV48_00345, partial [Pseudomonadales bacterium]|nr:hypothetical protein [Pseudomonadales bacterium]
RHWFSTLLAKILEPVAVKNAALITGVAEGYYLGVVDRNPHLVHSCRFAAMPYGGEPNDHAKAAELGAEPFLFAPHSDKIRLVYAGAFLPKSIEPLKAILRAMASDPQAYENLEIHFIGTGVRRAGGLEPTVRPIAREFGLEGSVIFEHPERLPYFDVLTHLNAASGVFILGSTEPHYTPSKVYQAVLSNKYILAVLHAKSTAVDVLQHARAGEVLAFDGENDLDRIETSWPAIYRQYTQQLNVFDPAQRNLAAFEPYSAKAVTRKLVDVLNSCVRCD